MESNDDKSQRNTALIFDDVADSSVQEAGNVASTIDGAASAAGLVQAETDLTQDVADLALAEADPGASVASQPLPQRLLLHACCGPCSLEPVRLLRQRGIEPHIFYANSNIHPADEYSHRLDTICAWAESEGVAITEGAYAPEIWEETAGKVGEALMDAAKEADSKLCEHADEMATENQASTRNLEAENLEEMRKARCRACYRMRFEESAKFAAENGFDALGSTLSVSPYQYTDIICEELERACSQAGIGCFFEDYSPYYREATRRSRGAGMYRQNFCGCRFSKEEARIEREQRAKEREARKAARAKAREPEEKRLRERRKERAEYDAKQARKRAILKQLRNNPKQ